MNALGYAIRGNHERTAILLIKHGADPRAMVEDGSRFESHFELAVRQRCSAVVGQVLGQIVTQGAVDTLSDLLQSRDSSGLTPLHRSLAQDDIVTAKYLAMVDIALDSKVKEVLHGAASTDDVALFKSLMKLFSTLREPYKIDIDCLDEKGGQTALLIACEHGSATMVKALLLRGANPLAQTVEGGFNVFHW